MKKLVIVSAILLTIVSFPVMSDAQGFYVRTTDLMVKSFELSSLQSLIFDNNNLLLKKTTGDTEMYALSNISALYFSSLYTRVSTICSPLTGKISVFPNPAGFTLRIEKFSQKEDQVFILGMDGRLLIRATVTRENPEISLSGLTRGMYILKTENQAIKFIKQ